MEQKLNREELAALEVGNTTISRRLAVGSVFIFLLFILFVPCYQFISQSIEAKEVITTNPFIRFFHTPQRREKMNLWQENAELLRRMNSFEQELEEGSFLRSWLLPFGQRALLGLGSGNEKVYPGRQAWLFYRPDMDYLMEAGFLTEEKLKQKRNGEKIWEKPVHPDPVKAIIDFQQQLVKRGISLILMPTPIKACVHPEFFTAGNFETTLQNRSWSDFINAMHNAGVLVFDPAPVLAEYKQENGNIAYLRTDTHWNPEAMESVASKLADYIHEIVPLAVGTKQLQRHEKLVENRGDIENMLLIPDRYTPYQGEWAKIHPVVSRTSELWQPSADAEILLLGDSFSNIFSLSGMGWGEGAGFGEQLSYFLQRDIDVILQNDAGAYATREILAAELFRGRDRLAGKKIVVWQFAVRELASGDWKLIPMELNDVPESDFFVPGKNGFQQVTGIVASISRSPIPGSVPYKDNIVTLHLVDIRDFQTKKELGQSLVYGWGMRDNMLTDFAKLRVGQSVTLQCVDWDAVQNKYSSYRRSPLDDEMLELELPIWGELLP